MDFGHVPNVDHFRFKLPADDPRNGKSNRATKNKIHVYSGGPVWSHKKWVGKLYPPKIKAKDFLKFYALQMNSIELNSTFYKTPSIETVLEWKNSVPKDFKFFPKFPQQISRSNLTCPKEEIVRFGKTMMELGENLGTSFLQMPPSFSPKFLPRLHAFLKWMPKKFPIAVELRNPDWFRNGVLIPEAYDALSEAGATTVITDTAGRRDVLHSSLTSSTAFIRFLGNDLHPSDYSRIDEWIERLRAWTLHGVTDIYFFMHHQGYTLVPDLVQYFVTEMNQKLGLDLRKIGKPEEIQMSLL